MWLCSSHLDEEQQQRELLNSGCSVVLLPQNVMTEKRRGRKTKK